MVNIHRIKCLSPFKQYEMYHWGCGDGDTYNTTYNFNGGSIFGGSFGGGFWNGVGMGLGAGIASLFGFSGGGCFGGGWNFGQNFFGVPQLTTPTRNFFADYYGQYRHTGDGAGGQSTTTGGSITTDNTTYTQEKTDKTYRRYKKRYDKLCNEKKWNDKKSPAELRQLYSEIVGWNPSNEDDKNTLVDSIKRLAEQHEVNLDNIKKPEIEIKNNPENTEHKDPAAAERPETPQTQTQTQTPAPSAASSQSAPEESFEDKVSKCNDFNKLLALIDGNYNNLSDAEKAAFNAKFGDLLETIKSDKKALEQLKISVADYGDLLSKVTAKIRALETAEEADEADEADNADETIKQDAQEACNQELNNIKMDNKGTVMKNATIDDLSTLGENKGKGISIIDTSDKIPDFINKTVKLVDLEDNTITVGVTNETDIQYRFLGRIHDETGALVFISNKDQQEYLLQKDDKGNIFLIQYNGMKGHNRGDLREDTKDKDDFGI